MLRLHVLVGFYGCRRFQLCYSRHRSDQKHRSPIRICLGGSLPAGKTRNFPTPGTHSKCRECPISLICISGRRRFGKRFWCNTCRGVYYQDLDMVIRCVVFRNKRGRYETQLHCPTCAKEYPVILAGGVTIAEGARPHLTSYDVSRKGHGQIITGIDHRTAHAWKNSIVESSNDTKPPNKEESIATDSRDGTSNP